MPELPDVESFRRYCSSKILRKTIENVQVKVRQISEVPEKELQQKLKNRKFTNTYRHGKHLFLKTSNNYYLVLHFGMTGDVSYYREKEPEHTALIVSFRNGYNFAVISVRKLGRIGLIKDKNKYVKEKEIGPDVLKISKKEFTELVEGSRGKVKSTLMNQGTMAGIGNIYSDEILYQAGMHPEKEVSKLSRKDIEKLYAVTQRVLKTAIRNNALPENFPSSYLTGKREEGSRCGICNGTIKRISSGGRSAYFCSKHQKK